MTLKPYTSITRSLGRYRECGISHGVEHGNDFTDREETRRDCNLLVIGACYHIGGVNNDEHDMIGAEPSRHGSDGWVPIYARIDPFECAVTM